MRNTDLQPRFPQQTEPPNAPPEALRPASYFGQEATRQATREAQTAQPAASGEGYELNFENAPVTTVAKVILGDILGAGYMIDSRVQGTVTLSSGRPVPRGDLIVVLENALHLSNVVLVSDSTGFRLIPSGDAQSSGGTRRTGEAGYGITAVPLRYASAQTILKLLDSFAIKAGMARAVAGRNLILVQGNGPERSSAVETIMSFDVDWMRGQSVGIYPVQYAAPEAMITELEKIMENGEGGLNKSLITLQPVSRLNAILVVSKMPDLLMSAATWIERLDKANNAGAAVRVYRLHYSSARQIARLLNDIFGVRSASGLDSEVNQIAPGAGLTTTSSAGRLAATSMRESSRSDSKSESGQRPGGGTVPPGHGGAGDFGGSGGLEEEASGAQNGQPPPSTDLPGVRITADVANNALVIFANQEKYRLIEQTLAQLDRPQLQVAIHATIAEITLNNNLQYGVQYFIQSSDLGLGHDKGSFGLVNSATEAVLSRVLPGFNLLLGPETNPRVIIDALRNVTDVKILSSPSVVVMDNQVATLQVGDEVPVATQSATILTNPDTPLVNTIEYRDTGVILRVLPRINSNGTVILDVEQEISNVANTASAATLTPTLSQRKIKSSIGVASGQSVLVGGLISETHQRGRRGIPVLEEIPIVGDAFSHNVRTTTRTELIIFIQPQIIRDSVDAYKVAEELRTKLRGSSETAFPPGPSLHRDANFVQ